MKKKLFLHIGLHKTGTTTLQVFFNQNRDNLYNCDYLYPRTGIPEKYDAQHNLGWLMIKSKQASSIFGNWQEAHKEIENTNCNHIIISSESFGLANPENIKNLKSELSFYEIKIIVYIRRQDLILESIYIQYLKQGILSEKNSNNILSFLDKIRSRLHYEHLLEPWAKEFGRENLIVRPLEKAQIPNICYDFLRQINIDNFDNFTSINNQNIKPGKKTLEILKFINKIYENKPPKIKSNYLKKITHFTSKHWLNDRNYRLLSYLESTKILKYYEKSNQVIAREYLGRKDGVLFYEQLEPYSNNEFDLEDLNKKEVLNLVVSILNIKIEDLSNK